MFHFIVGSYMANSKVAGRQLYRRSDAPLGSAPDFSYSTPVWPNLTLVVLFQISISPFFIR